MIVRRLESPQSVTLAEMKAQARIMHDDEDVLAQRLLAAAHERAEQETGRVFGEGQWRISGGGLSGTSYDFPIWPVTEVLSVVVAGVPIGGVSLVQRGRYASIEYGTAWPTGAAEILVQAGEPMPETVRHAVLLMAAHWFNQREAASNDDLREMPYACTALLGMNRRMFA